MEFRNCIWRRKSLSLKTEMDGVGKKCLYSESGLFSVFQVMSRQNDYEG
jgi:hypothetical protein